MTPNPPEGQAERRRNRSIWQCRRCNRIGSPGELIVCVRNGFYLTLCRSCREKS